MTLNIHLSSNNRTLIGTDIMTAWFVKGVGLVKYLERQELGAMKEDRGLVTEIIEELEEFDVKIDSSSLGRRESPPDRLFAHYPSHEELP